MKNEMRASYNAVIRAVHWVTLALIAGLFILAWAIDELPLELRSPALQIHKSLGITVLSLTIVRLLWRFGAGVPDMPSDLPMLQKLAARVTQYALYALLQIQPLVGWLWSSAEESQINYFFLIRVPWLISPDKQLSKTLGHLHGLLGNVLLGLIGLHAAAALYHHFVRRDDILRSMVRGEIRSTGDRTCLPHPDQNVSP
jgi:cytochrome b561